MNKYLFNFFHQVDDTVLGVLGKLGEVERQQRKMMGINSIFGTNGVLCSRWDLTIIDQLRPLANYLVEAPFSLPPLLYLYK